jgi:cysteine desulfurase/selenocysteine lyase
MITQQYPLLTKTTYLNTAYVGLMSSKLFEFRRTYEESFLLNGGDHYKMDAYEALDSMHQNFGSFFGVKADRCFGIPNFSSGIRTALTFLPKKMNVLLLEEDYPSLTQAFLESDFKCTKIPIQPKIEEAIEQKLNSENTDILVLSLVQYTSGLSIDHKFLKRIKEVFPDLLIIGDGTQFLGAHEFQFDSSPFDLVVASGYKWLLAGFGNGILMTSEGFVDRALLSVEEMRGRFFQGHFNILAMASLDFAIKELQDYGFENLVKMKTALSEQAKRQLTALEFLPQWVAERADHSSIFTIQGNQELFQFLLKKNIRTVLRGSGVRVSFHFYNTKSDLDKLIDSLKEYQQTK